MKTGAVIALIICGSILVALPWFYAAYHNHLVAGILNSPESKSVTLYNESSSPLKWWSVLIGVGMIITGMVGTLRREVPRRGMLPEQEAPCSRLGT